VFPALRSIGPALIAVLGFCGGIVWLSHLARDRGKALEPTLFQAWGGMPSTAMLRHRDGRLSGPLKARYKSRLRSNLPDLDFPTPEMEANDPAAADAIYEAAGAWLLALSRPISAGVPTITVTPGTAEPELSKRYVLSQGTNLVADIPAVTATFTNPSQFVFCAAADYIVETVTVDLRDIAAKTDPPKSSTDGGQPIWSIVLHSAGGKFIRINTQTFAPNCGPNPTPDSKIQQRDDDSYPIVFTYQEEAARFQQIVSNAIPTLSPLIFIGPPTQ
jgi:hypothetical protein